jgi:tRNA 2-thiocytidine biosynthesis protein TtcA
VERRLAEGFAPDTGSWNGWISLMDRENAMTEPLRQLERQLFRRVRSSCEDHALLEPGDRVMVAVSGGKDSYTLLQILHLVVARLPFEVSLVAVHLDQEQPEYDGRPLESWLEGRGYEFEILREDTYSVVTERLDEASTYCSLCSRLRRGILYTAAERLSCNKIALGHHRDDGLETFLMNLFFSGKLQALPASYTTDDGRFQVIRPLIDCPEALIREYAALSEFPILPCNLCGSQPGLQRDAMAALIDSLEERHPNVRSVMAAALGNVVPGHLLDRTLLAVVRENEDAAGRAAEAVKPRVRHAGALPVRSGPRRLPLL